MNGLKKRGVLILLVLTFFIFLIPFSIAEENYKPYLHKPIVPHNPGLNLQGSFQTSLWTGGATYSYPLDVPKGRNNLQPILSLNYNSHQSTQRSSIIGSGWTLSKNYILRNVNYSFSDSSDDSFILILNGQQYNLVYDSSDDRYHTEIESYFHIQNKSGSTNNSEGEYWILKTTDGTNYRFGFNDDSELVSNIQNYVTKWSLDLINDTYNNQIYFSYNESPTTNDLGAVYPNKIEYNNERSKSIEFVLEDTDRPDRRIVYEQGNKISEARRVSEIKIKTNNNLVRKYGLNYTSSNLSSMSFISSITLFGNDGITSLPPITFEYFNITKGWEENVDLKVPQQSLNWGSDDVGGRLLDLNRDGLLDLVQNDELTSGNNKSRINNGTAWVQNDSWNIPYTIVDDFYLDTGMRFIDFNGDGFIDIVRGDGSTRKSWKNSMNGWVEDSSWHLPTNANPVDDSSGIYERGVRFIDFNGDGLIDILSATDDWNYAWIHNGTGWELDSSWEVPSSAIFSIYPSGEDEGVRISDINGDGLPDLVKNKQGDSTTVWINNGTNWESDSSWVIPSNNYFINSSGGDLGVRLIDANGDGLVDILKGYRGSESSWINNGTGWVEDSSWNVPEDANFVIDGIGNVGVRLIDVNGDGLVDLVNDANNPTTYVSKARKSYLLEEIRNNLGGHEIINYMKSTQLDNEGSDDYSDLGFNLWIVSSVSKDNGVESLHNITNTIYYFYENGYYDYELNEFRGFNHADEINPSFTITSHWFNQSDALKGLEYKTEILDNESNIYRKMEVNWKGHDQGGYYITNLTSKKDYLYGGKYDNIKIIETQYSYDNYGNTISINYLGDNSTQNDERYEYYEYLANNDKWIVDKLKHYSLFDADDSTKLTEIWVSYDGLQYDQNPTKGGITSLENWLEIGSNIVTNYSYDQYGNLANETDANGYVTQYIRGIRDSTYTFVDKIINAKNHETNYFYDLGTGNLLSEIDANNFVSNYTYDKFGRIEQEILPFDSIIYPTKNYEYLLNNTGASSIKISFREKTGTSNTYDEYYFYDGFGNLIQIRNEVESSKQSSSDIYYDSLNRVVEQSNPYFITSGENYFSPNQTVNKVGYKYDPLSRVTFVTNPDTTAINITYDGWEVTQYDENNNKLIYENNAYDQIVKITEYGGNNYFETTYGYDSRGYLLQINDSFGRVINYSYDSIGREIKEENLDSGIWEYNYDNVGNLINQLDNKGNNISLTYDGINRLIQKNSSDETISYYYDEINGTLQRIESSIIITNYSYNNRLRVTEEITTLDGISFTKQWTYDSLGRIETETFPDNSVLVYNYTSGSKMNKITNILDNVDYNEFGLPTKLSYQNNLDTDTTYNLANSYIEKIKTGTKQELIYGYDLSGNILLINDSISDLNDSMTYDELDRLASSQREGSQNSFNFNYIYDSLGNMLKMIGNENNLTYYYGSNPSHAPKKIITTEIINGTSSPVNDTHKFYVRDSSGSNVGWLGDEGNIVLKGSCFTSSNCVTNDDSSFIIGNSTDSSTFFINSTGDLCLESGDCTDQSASCNPSENAFIIRDSSSANMSYITYNGDLCLTGSLYENSNP